MNSAETDGFVTSRRSFMVAAFGGLSGCASAMGTSQSEEPSPEVYMNRLTAFGFTGGVFVAQNGETVLSRGYGFANRAAGVPFTADTVLNVASFSKTITAAAVMKLVESGHLSLTDPISLYVSNAPTDKASITIEQLLSHSAALARDSLRNQNLVDRTQALAIMLAAPLRGAPGSRMAYSNDGYRLLAVVIERATQRPFRDVVRELVFQPASMTSAGFIGEDLWPAPRIAIGYNEWQSVGTFRDWRSASWELDGAGSVVASAADLGAFMNAYIAEQLVNAASVEAMANVQARNDEESYGYGWFVNETGARVLVHGGDTPGYHTEVRWYPSKQLVIIVATTQEFYDESGNGLGVQKRIIATNLRRLLDRESFVLPPASRAISSNRAAALVGTYQTSGGGVLTLSEPFGPNAGVWIGAAGQSAVSLLEHASPEREQLFAARNAAGLALANAVGAQDREQLRQLLGQDLLFMLDALIDAKEDAAQRFGAFTGVELLGTRSEITGDDHVRTIVRVRFAQGSYDLGFTWRGESLYETMTETGIPNALMLPVAQISADRLGTYDFIGQGVMSIRTTVRDGVCTRLTIDGVDAIRNR